MNLVLTPPWFPNVGQHVADGRSGRGWTQLAATDQRVVGHTDSHSFASDDGWFHARTLRQ